MDFNVDYMAASTWDGDMRERLDRLRETHPVYWSEINRLWVVTRYADVTYVSKNHQIFCSGHGVRPGNPTKLGLIDEDEPRHTRLRKLLNRGFTPRMVKKLEEVFRGLVTDAIDAVARHGECDFVDDIAVPMPLLLIAEMIGIRKEDRQRFHHWSDALIAGDGNLDNPEVRAGAAKAFVEYTAYVQEIFEERRREPRDDLASILLKARDEGVIGDLEHHGAIEALDLAPGEVADDELTMMMVLLLVAGNETTRNGLSGGMELLIRNPEERRKLIDDPALIPSAVEEMLRVVSPVQNFGRTVTRDTELRGTKLAKGDTVLMIYPAANRDPEAFEDPLAFRVERNPHHLAFGIGNHFCMGANLARMEMRVTFAELLRRLPDMEFSRGGPEIVPSSLVRTCKQMWVKYTPEA
jgi:cytochrome P450